MAKQASVPGGARLTAARRLVTRLGGARLCYGAPVTAGDRVVIPVARLRVVGGMGFGNGPGPAGELGEGGGGGGLLEADPVGFIEIGPDGSRWTSIDRGRSAAQALAVIGAAAAAATRIVALRRALASRGEGGRRLRRPQRVALPSPQRSLRR